MEDQVKLFGGELVTFAVEGGRGDVPSFYEDSFLNWFGCAVAGSGRDAVRRAATFLQDDEPGEFSPIGRSESVSVPACVLLDCMSSAALAYDDIHFATTLHPTGPVAAALLGVARRRKFSGQQILTALRVGMEVECRMAVAATGAAAGAAKGWYPTGVAGCIGAAAAVGRLLGFDTSQMQAAFGIAASRACGTRGTHGSMAGYSVPAWAAEGGYVSARLAEEGFTCTLESLVGDKGLIQSLASTPNIEAALDGIGERYLCEETACKPYPFGFVGHAVAKCCLDLLDAMRVDERPIERIVMSVSSTSADIGRNPSPATEYEAIVSIPYLTARIMTNAELAFVPIAEHFSIEPEIARMMERVSVEADGALSNDQAHAVVEFAGGDVISARCDAAPGSPSHLPTTADIEDKFKRQVSRSWGDERAAEAFEVLRNFAQISDASKILCL